jgi:hypothetical protein
MTKQSLFELNDNQKLLMNLILNSSQDSEDDEINQKQLKELLEKAKKDMSHKVDAYVYIIKNLEAESESLKAKANYLQAEVVENINKKATTIQKNADRMKKVLEEVAKDNDGKLLGEHYKVNIQKGTYSAKINDKNLVPGIHKYWNLTLNYSDETLSIINSIFDQYNFDKSLTALDFITTLIKKLDAKENIDKKSLVKALKEGKVSGAELNQAEFMKIY